MSLNKKLLRKLEAPETPEFPYECGSDHILLLSARDAEVEGEPVLILDMYTSGGADAPAPVLSYRAFLADKDYVILAFCADGTTKWRTCRFEKLDGYDDAVRLLHEKHSSVVRNFLKRVMPDREDADIFVALYRYQVRVEIERWRRKNDAKKRKIDLELAIVPEDIPKDFKEFVRKKVFAGKRYLIYQSKGKKNAACYCEGCGTTRVLARKENGLTHKGTYKCPECGETLTVLAKGRTKSVTDNGFAVYLAPLDNGMAARFFYCSKHLEVKEGEEEPVVTYRWFESVRNVLTYKGCETTCKGYQYRRWSSCDTTERWCREREIKGMFGIIPAWAVPYYVYENHVLYTGNLRKALRNTPFRYTTKRDLKRYVLSRKHHIFTAFLYPEYIFLLEKLGKMGFTHLADLFHKASQGAHNLTWMEESKRFLNKRPEAPEKLLGLSTEALAFLNDNKAELQHFRIARLFAKHRIPLDWETVRRFANVEELRGEGILEHRHGAGIDQICEYLENAKRKIQSYHTPAILWNDYLRMAKKLGYNLRDKSRYFPEDLEFAHNKVVFEQRLKDNPALNTLYEQRLKPLKKAMALIGGKTAPCFRIDGTGLMLIVPARLQDLVVEGTRNKNCVASYAEDVAKAKTSIFFIRREDAPEKPFYTLEWNHGKVIQCHGACNCDMTPEVETFVNNFKERMQAKAQVIEPLLAACA